MRMKRMARSRARSSIGLFIMMPFVVATQAVKCPSAMEYAVWGMLLALGFWGVLQNRCPNCGRFYRPFRFGMRETERCPRCQLNLKTGKFD